MGAIVRLLPLAANGPAAYFFLIAAILLLIITLMLRLIRYSARQSRAADPSRRKRTGGPEGRALRADAPEQIVRWEVEMQELARDLKAEIDSKAVVLGHLIREADRAARRLESLTSSEPGTGRHGAEPADERSSAWPCDLPPGVRDEIYMLADYGFLPEDIAARVEMPAGQIELILRRRERKE